MKKIALIMIAAAGLLAFPVSASAQEHRREMRENHREVALQEPVNSHVARCKRVAEGQLQGNDWHADLGYSNIVAWTHRKDIMREFRTCVSEALKNG